MKQNLLFCWLEHLRFIISTLKRLVEMSFVLAQSYAYACAYARAYVDAYVAHFAESIILFNLLSRSLCLCLRLVKTSLKRDKTHFRVFYSN